MKRKLLSVLLTLCLAFSLLPTAALADAGADPVAQIGEKTYATLKAAFEEAKDGDTVTLLKNVETNNIEDTEAARIIIDKAITLNLNDKTIRTPDNMGNNNTNFTALIVDADVIINATTGGINTGKNGGYGINVRNGATLTINGGTYYGGGTAVQVQKGTLIINDGTFDCEPYSNPTYGYKFLINCIDAAWKDGTAKISIKGGTFVKFDPSDSASENPKGNFCASGYVAVKSGTDDAPVWTVEDHRVAEVGNNGYSTLAAAVAAAQNGDTITLLKDATGRISVSAGTTLTLDLGGHKLSNDSYALDVYGNLTVKNGTVETPADASIWVNNGGTFTLEADATVKANAGRFCVAVYGAASQTDVTANITIKGTLEGGSGLTVNGYINAGNTTITVADGAKILGDANSSVGLYLAGKATTTVGNAEIVCYDSAVEIRAGELNITSGKFTATGVPTTVAPNGNGTTSTGAAIAVAQHTTKQEINVNISGGEFNGYSTLYESNPQKNGAEDIAKVHLSVSGGKFAAISGGTMAMYSEDCTGFITGGLFTSDPTAYLAASKGLVTSDQNAFAYKVGDKTTDVKTAVTAGEAVVTIPVGVDGITEDTVKNAAKAADTTKTLTDTVAASGMTNDPAVVGTKEAAEAALTAKGIPVNSGAMEEMISHNWMTADDVANIVAIAEMTPGSLGVNCATFAGTQTAGVLGGTAAVMGVLTPTLTLTLAAALFFQKFRESKVMLYIMRAVKPICVGMIFAVLITLSGSTYFAEGISWAGLGIGLLCFWLLRKKKMAIPKVIGIAAVLGLVCFGVL